MQRLRQRRSWRFFHCRGLGDHDFLFFVSKPALGSQLDAIGQRGGGGHWRYPFHGSAQLSWRYIFGSNMWEHCPRHRRMSRRSRAHRVDEEMRHDTIKDTETKTKKQKLVGYA